MACSICDAPARTFCKAKPNSDPQQDCDWPFCGCDPVANKVIEAIEESGRFSPARTEPTKPRCVIGEYCSRHNFIHGAEAEELRQRLGALRKTAVDAVLDDVDARDSLAWCEFRQMTDD